MNKSRLVLGTAQLGMDYGVANTHGAPSRAQAFAILDQALAGGINTFDTAAAYGSAENVLGDWIEVRGVVGEVHVISKMSGAAGSARDQIGSSLKRLRFERLDGCLLHTPKHLRDEQIMAGLREAKDAGLAAHIGVSVYDPADAMCALDLGLEYIQAPYNAFDQRLDATDFFSRAKARGATVFARSPFLQGLLLMEPERVPPYLAHARPYLERFIDITVRHSVSQLEAALVFALRSRADMIVFGAERPEQLAEILDIAQRADALAGDWIEEVRNAFCYVKGDTIDPRAWNH